MSFDVHYGVSANLYQKSQLQWLMKLFVWKRPLPAHVNNEAFGETLCVLRVTRNQSSRWRWRSPIWNRMTSLLIVLEHRRNGKTMVSMRTPYLMRDLIHRMKTGRGQGISYWNKQPKLPYTDATAYTLSIRKKRERFKACLEGHARIVKPIVSYMSTIWELWSPDEQGAFRSEKNRLLSKWIGKE